MFDGVIFVEKKKNNYQKIILPWKEPIEITFQQQKNHETCLSNRLINFSFLFNFPACNNDISDENSFRLWGPKKRVSSGDFKQAPEQPTSGQVQYQVPAG